MTDLAHRSATSGKSDELHIDVAALGETLLGRWADVRRASRALVAREEFHQIPGQPMPEHRERVLAQLRRLVEERTVLRAFPAAYGGFDDHGGNLAQFEELVIGDASLQIKSGV